MATYAFVAPIVPGKMEQWRRFVAELKGVRHVAYLDNRKKAGIQREQAFLQKTPQGDFVVVVLETNDPAAAARGMASSDTFGTWFQKEVQEIHGFSLAEVARHPPNELALDSKA